MGLQLSLLAKWDKQCLTSNITHCIKKTDMNIDIILSVFWVVWRERNMCIFQEITADTNKAGIKALRWLNAYGSLHRMKNNRVIK